MVVWIGLVNVIPMPGNDDLKGAKGAYVNVIALASSSEDYRVIVSSEMSALSFYVVNIENVEQFSERINCNTLSQELYEIADNIQKSGGIGFGTFHAYHEDETLN